MNNRCDSIAARVDAFAREVIDYASALSEESWAKTCAWEQWSVGTTVRHIGNHLGIFELAGMVVRGEQLPPWTMDDINAMANADSAAHRDCTKAEALGLIEKQAAGLTAFLGGLTEADLDRQASMPAFGGAVTVEQLIDFVVLQSAAKHFASIRAAVAE